VTVAVEAAVAVAVAVHSIKTCLCSHVCVGTFVSWLIHPLQKIDNFVRT